MKITAMETTPRKTMAELKIDIIEVLVNSPVGIEKPVDELLELCERSADFVFSYEPPKIQKQHGL
jgi:hypothetical protein